MKLLQLNSPFYTAYTQNKEVIGSAIETAIHDSSEKIGKDLVNELFSIRATSIVQKKSA